MNDEIQTVPMAAFEAQAERNVRAIRLLSVGWAASVIALCILMLTMICLTTVETETEEVEESTTHTVSQDTGSGDGNMLNYAGGDINGNTNSYNDYNQEDDANQDD